MSRMIEDDPAMAAKFSQALGITGDSIELWEQVCQKGEEAEICPPTTLQLRQLGLASALPFLGFGILDNAIMIAFGDVLDLTFCTTFGFSTMAAAALGNTVSDGFGVFSGGVVEDMAAKAGFEAPPLSRAQQALAITKRWERTGQLVGITIGCLIGMFPLYFINLKEQEAWKREKSLEHMYEHVVVAVEDLLHAEAAMIVLVDHQTQELYTLSAAHHGTQEFDFRMRMGEGIIGKVAESGHFVNIADIKAPESRQYYTPEIHDNFRGTGIRVKSCLCMPIIGYDEETGKCDKVMGVVSVINKQDGGHFSGRDEDALAALCSHISSSLSYVHAEEHGFEEALDRCARALRTKGIRINAAANQRVHDLYVEVLSELARIHMASCVEVLTLNAEDKATIQKLASSLDGHNADDVEIHPMAAYAAMHGVADTREPCILNVECEEGGTSSSLRSTICCPIFDGSEEIIGGLHLRASEAGHEFTTDDVESLQNVARKLALTMEGTGASLTRLLRDMQQTN